MYICVHMYVCLCARLCRWRLDIVDEISIKRIIDHRIVIRALNN